MRGFLRKPFLTGEGRKLTYVTDERGNRILDYSSCGYRNSEYPIPDVANAVFVSWKPGDNSSRIQRAIDYVSSLALDKNGFVGLFCWIKELLN